MKGIDPNSLQAEMLLRALVSHLYNTGGTCSINYTEMHDEKIVQVVEEDEKLTIIVTLKRTGNIH